VVALIGATMALSTVAQARTVQDPMLSNIPYLAWRGEAVRLVKCFPASAFPAGYIPSALDAGFTLVDWSGDPHLASPQVVTGAPGFNAAMFDLRSFDGAYCWGQSFISQKAGLANIKLTIRDGTNGPLLAVHDFLVGWMNLNSIVLCNNSAAGLCTGPTTETITDFAGATTPNVLEANVTGNIPLLQDFNELGIGHPITIPDGTTVNGLVMPADWATLASAMATVRGPLGDPVSFWDTHDDTLATEGHAQESPAGICTPRVTTGIDAVDQCSDGGNGAGSLATSNEVGGYSAIWTFPTPNGLSVPPTIGPFDPARSGQTYLSDGKVDAGDAPMPSARIDFTIASNTGGTDIGGVGTFTKIDKGLCPGQSALNDAGGEPAAPFGCTNSIYVRPGATTPHHLYAPFYREYLPATFAPLAAGGDPFSSGIDGGFSNDFNGFLNLGGNALANPTGLYDYWDIAEVLRTATAANTSCLFRFVGGVPVFQTTPGTGPQSVAIYSDEHGEARTGFLPGTGFFFDAFGIQNANQGCDLAGVATLGTARITATARYPFEDVTARPLVSNTVAKAVASLFVKQIQCFPKGPSAFDQMTAVCIVGAKTITGAAIAGERVCFFADHNANGAFLPALASITVPFGFASFTATSTTVNVIPAPSLNGTNTVCAFTDVNGLAAVEVVNSNPTVVDVTAFFVDEGLMRSVHVTFPISGPQPAAGPVTGPIAASVTATGTTGSHSGSTTATNPATHQGTPATPVRVDPNVKVKYRITFARLSGKVLRVRLSGPAGRGNLAVSYLAKSKKMGTLIRTVPANKIVKLRLQIPTGVKKLRLSVMPG